MPPNAEVNWAPDVDAGEMRFTVMPSWVTAETRWSSSGSIASMRHSVPDSPPVTFELGADDDVDGS